jgi:hypothetical protein
MRDAAVVQAVDDGGDGRLQEFGCATRGQVTSMHVIEEPQQCHVVAYPGSIRAQGEASWGISTGMVMRGAIGQSVSGAYRARGDAESAAGNVQ